MATMKMFVGALLTIMKSICSKHTSFINPKQSLDNYHSVQLLKQFSANDYYFSLVHNTTSFPPGHCFIWNINQLDSFLTFPMDGKSIVLTNMTDEMELSKLSLTINQEVYIFNWKSMKLYETYSINGVKVTNDLGQLIKDEESGIWTFIRSNPMKKSFVRRRGNFHGKNLVGMVNVYAPSVVLPKNFEDKAKYFPVNETYDVTDHVSGTYISFLRLSQRMLNFTSKIYIRKDRVWGSALQFKNGTTQFTGMLQNVVEGNADFIWSVIARYQERNPYLDYLPNMNAYYGAIYLPRLEESYDWSVFIAPFTADLWIAIVITSVITAILIIVLERIHFNNHVSVILDRESAFK